MSILSTVLSRSKTICSEIAAAKNSDFFITYSQNLDQWPNRPKNSCTVLVLDSSFNPPTLAHRTLLTGSLDHFPKDFFDASIMLFSTRNVDKQLTGASVLQRAQMMEIMARQLGDTNYKALQNIAVALTPHGRFIDKATHIHTFFKSRFNNVPVELYFIMGFDTITRFMDPVYYAEGRDKVLQTFFRDSNLICADRPGYDDNAGVFWSDQVGPYTKRITRIKLDDNIACLSSTLARTKVKVCSAKDNELEKVLDKDIIDYIESQELYK